MQGRCTYACAMVALTMWLTPIAARGQTPPAGGEPATTPSQEPAHDHMHMDGMNMDMDGGWHFMQDGVVFGIFNHQGGSRGGDDEFKAPNWWMGMWDRTFGHQQLTLTSMFSLDRATVGRSGYAELFQSGETLDGVPLVDRQHPHDFFMQLSAAWRIPLGSATSLTLSGGPAAAPALGPVAFMHRPSAADNPAAPLGHHTFDSTHISFGVVTAGLTHAGWTVEGSAFNGREPDENRWDLDLAPLDSFSGRVWFRPDTHWELQASTGRLKDPEELEPGNVLRTTFSASWLQPRPDGTLAITAGYGMNRRDDERRASAFTEAAWRAGKNSVYGRLELHEPEVAVLLGESAAAQPPASRAHLLAFTLGGVRDVVVLRGFRFGLGADITAYAVPEVLQTGGYGQPVSFHVFVRLRLPPMGGSMAGMKM